MPKRQIVLTPELFRRFFAAPFAILPHRESLGVGDAGIPTTDTRNFVGYENG